MKISKPSNVKRILVIVGIILLLLGTVAFIIFQNNKSSSNVRRDKNGTSIERSESELSESEEIQDNPEASKKSTGSDTVAEPAADPTTGLKSVNVVLTSTGVENGQVDASGFVSNLVEENGTCKFTFTQNSKVITKTSGTATNPTSTTCTTVRFSETELGKGEWKVLLDYNSSTATGTSNEGSLVIK